MGNCKVTLRLHTQFMTKGDSQKEDKKTYRQWRFCNTEPFNKDIHQLRRSVYSESSIYLCSCGRCLVVNIVGRQIHYMHAIKHVGVSVPVRALQINLNSSFTSRQTPRSERHLKSSNRKAVHKNNPK